MSMKVYDAYKVKDPKMVWTLLWAFKTQVQKELTQRLKDHYWQKIIELDPESEEYREAVKKRTSPQGDLFQRLDIVHEGIKKAYKESSTSPYRDEYNLDVSICVFPHKGQFYLRAIHDQSSVFRGVLDFMDKHRGLEDFHFQDQCDKPKRVPMKAWLARKKIWEEIADERDTLSNNVALEICRYDFFYKIDPWLELCQAWHKDPPKLPSREEVWAAKIQKRIEGKVVKGHPGLITVGNKVLVRRVKTRWFSLIDGKKKYHPDLNRAADYASFRHMPEDLQRTITRMMLEHRKREAKEKRALAKKQKSQAPG